MSSISMRIREGKPGAVAERDVEFAWFFRTEYEAVVRTMYLIVHDREQARVSGSKTSTRSRRAPDGTQG